jgi:PucR-like helix-turn-helix protein/diguanylate cyclase with GGDEF domain
VVWSRPFVEFTMPELAEAIRADRDELHREVLERIQAIDDPRLSADSEFAAGTRAAVFAALDYAVAVLESEERYPPPIPEALLDQARVAARTGIDLATLLRRYMAGFSLLGEVALRDVDISPADRDRLLPVFSMHLDYLLARVSEDYELAQRDHLRSPRTKRAEAITMLLAGTSRPFDEIDHVWDAWHVGLVADGSQARERLLSLGSGAGGRLLLEQVEGQAWAWVSTRARLDPGELTAGLPSGEEGVALGVGEPACGLDGWRRSHRQAAAALGIARRGGSGVAFYAEVGTLAAIIRDDLLVSSLRDRFVVPLGSDDRGDQLRQTLRGYLATECNVSATAAILGVSRRTVKNRISRVEERTGIRLGEYLGELDLAMQIAELNLA